MFNIFTKQEKKRFVRVPKIYYDYKQSRRKIRNSKKNGKKKGKNKD